MAKNKTPVGSAPPIIHELIARFADQQEVYHRGQYKEAMLRQDFLDPFFAALGWDMDNRKGYAEAFREVIHEDSLKVELSVKAPDYCFRIGGQRQFFVEAKHVTSTLGKTSGQRYRPDAISGMLMAL